MKCLCTETAQQPSNCAKCGKFLAIVYNHQQELSKQLHALHCTGTTFCYPTLYNTRFSLIPAMTCSYLPCIYSSHLILVSLFRGFEPPPPSATGPLCCCSNGCKMSARSFITSHLALATDLPRLCTSPGPSSSTQKLQQAASYREL